MKWLKRLGRFGAILTREDRHLDCASIETVLLIHRPGESHLPWAVASCRARFAKAFVTIITAEDVTRLLPPHPSLEVVRVPSRSDWRHLLTPLRGWRKKHLSAVVLLSLDPLTVALACLWFRGPRLLFNRWEEWFLVRRRTLVEVLTLRPGADRIRGMPREPFQPRLQWVPAGFRGLVRPLEVLVRLFIQPLLTLLRALTLVCWVGSTLVFLFWRRWMVSRKPSPLGRPQ